MPHATIRINSQHAVTDQAGDYEMLYVLTGVDNLNRPAEIEINAENYLPTSTTSLIFPDSSLQLDFELEYGAPIIDSAAQPGTVPGNCAGLPGHQRYRIGESFLSYVDNSGIIQQEIDVPLAFHRSASNLWAFYPAEVETTIGNLTVFRLFSVTVTDRSGFTDTLSHLNDTRNSDQPLFPE